MFGASAFVRRVVLSAPVRAAGLATAAFALAVPSYSASASSSSSSGSTTSPSSTSSSSTTPATTPSPPPPPSPLSSLPHRYATEYARLHPNLVVVESRALKLLFTTLRDESTLHLDFSTHADRLMSVLAEEGLANLPGVRPKTVTTPCGVYHGLEGVPPHTLAVVSIVRAGDTLLEAVRRAAPACAVGKILIQRDESDAEKRPKLFYVKVPKDIADRTVLLVDPMLATGQSASVAIEELVKRGVREDRIVFLNVVACPEGLAVLAARYPAVKVVTGAVDEGLNQERYIVPGLGDFGDRYMGTEEVTERRTVGTRAGGR